MKINLFIQSNIFASFFTSNTSSSHFNHANINLIVKQNDIKIDKINIFIDDRRKLGVYY